ncbi:neutral zinc metallopeptidase [Nitrosospira sp. NpAV]|uniref:KPN_02809 family neutral zinc metallopeptidase n=1 Tax=Nitrosospira sp. NpAV TaxID=58133 RepID=UPI0005A28827|nr:neutral zinc metallopeptidase [Nitrosospira sp. NpAV]KIO49153.1 metalloprotease [Nitrosospira sp. NpAV]
MKWEGHRRSDNVEDRRGSGMGGFGLGGRRIGIGTIVVALVGGLIFGVDPLTMLSIMSGGGNSIQEQGPISSPPPGDVRAAFVSTVLADTEDVWTGVMQQDGGTYRPPRLVLFRGAVMTSCGKGSAAMGPFYCPEDQRIYIDLDFFDTMATRLGASGDFAQAYVIAHEVGHHVQNLLGISGEVNQMRGHLPEKQANALSVRVELQADCYAGVWAHHSQRSKGWLEQGDIEEALNAAAQIGDDTLQRKMQGTVVPESFTHGTGSQRMDWFTRGLQSGNVAQCNTLEAKRL